MAAAWISYGELTGLIGPDAALALCQAYGGVALYIPKNIKADSDLARIVGLAALRVLATVYGGEVVTVPNRRKAAPRIRGGWWRSWRNIRRCLHCWCIRNRAY